MNKRATEYDIATKNASPAQPSSFAPEAARQRLVTSAQKSLSFDPRRDFAEWRSQVGAKLRELVGQLPSRVEPSVRVEFEKSSRLFLERRFAFTAEEGVDVPCHLLIPRAGTPPYPVVICLQGHTTGMHISLGRPKHIKDFRALRGDRDFAIQAVRQGYAALALEQRCFGERKDQRPPETRHVDSTCHHAAMTALLVGRTLIGERVWDVSRAIDALSTFPEIDPSRIGCMGQSAGGTVTYYAACLDDRIGFAMPSCAVCTYKDSLAAIDHCADNYLPRAMQFFEMADLACLIAPRPLIVVAGRRDGIFPIHGVEEAYNRIQETYRAAGAADRCALVVGEEGHRFYADQAWAKCRELVRWSAET